MPIFNVVGIEGVVFNDEDDAETNNIQGGQTGGQTGGQKRNDKTIDAILQLIKDNPAITRKALAETIAMSPSAIQKHISRLKEEGFIRRVGGDFGGHWEVLKG